MEPTTLGWQKGFKLCLVTYLSIGLYKNEINFDMSKATSNPKSIWKDRQTVRFCRVALQLKMSYCQPQAMAKAKAMPGRLYIHTIYNKLVRAECVCCPWALLRNEVSTIFVIILLFFSFFFCATYFSPRRGCPRIMKFCMEL